MGVFPGHPQAGKPSAVYAEIGAWREGRFSIDNPRAPMKDAVARLGWREDARH